MRLGITADHNGVALKRRLCTFLAAAGHEVTDLGVDDPDEVVDYPVLCMRLGRAVIAGDIEMGVVVGGSGSGEHMACNKIPGIRAGLALEPFTTRISRAHNNANVLVIGAKVVEPVLAEELLTMWLTTEFKGGRHQQRLDQLAVIEQGGEL